MGNQWGSTNFKQPYRQYRSVNVSLQEIVDAFPSKLKQAIFSAASTRTIARRTWNGCALNAAGMEIGRGNAVRSFESAAKELGLTTAAAKQFVKLWDTMGGSDDQCTKILRDTIEKAGLFIEPGDRTPRIIKIKVYEDQQKKMREQFDALMEANMIEGTDIMEAVLCGATI